MSGGAVKTTKNCSHHWAMLKANCLVVQQLVNLSGFGWDDSTKMVTAEESVWEKYLEAHSKAKHWHYNPFPLYEDILGLIEGCHATGEGALHILNSQESSDALESDATQIFPWSDSDTELSPTNHNIDTEFASDEEALVSSSCGMKQDCAATMHPISHLP
ncbi:hypothetical protein HD554DRAFT_2120038 [Boletus coccyginus]|nr:hypothetical protein HD554DRAFT_2120038 [Boletus coccyginus]